MPNDDDDHNPDFKAWCENQGLRPLSGKTVTRRLGLLGIGLDAGKRGYVGVNLGA